MHPVGGAGKGGKQQEAAGEDAERAGEEAVEAEAPGTVSNQTLAKAEKVAEEELEMSCFGADPILMFGDNLDESKQVDNPFLPRLSRSSGRNGSSHWTTRRCLSSMPSPATLLLRRAKSGDGQSGTFFNVRCYSIV